MNPVQPMMDGTSAWVSPPAPTNFYPDRDVGLSEAHRRLPAFMRLLGREEIEGLSIIDEIEGWSTMRGLSGPQRRQIHEMEFGEGTYADMRDFIVQSGPLSHHWKQRWAFRAPREFAGYRKVEDSIDVPHIEPFEAASWRLTDDIALDADVVAFISWCQGVRADQFARIDLYADKYETSLVNGLVKFHRSPWTALALAAPFMSPVGVLFPGGEYIQSAMRVEYLLKHHHHALDTELAVIMLSSAYRKAYEAAKIARAAGYESRSGSCFAGGVGEAMGHDFRRGGRQGKKTSTEKADRYKRMWRTRRKKAAEAKRAARLEEL